MTIDTRRIFPNVLLLIWIPFSVSCTVSQGDVLTSREPDTADTALDSVPTYSSALGMSPTGISDWTTSLPLIDLMRQAREWSDWNSGTTGPIAVDENGWVTTLSAGQTAGTVFYVNEEDDALYDRAVVRYDGQGTISYGWSAVKVEEESAPGRDVVLLSTGNHLLQIDATDPQDYIRNISIVPEVLLSDFDNGAVFSPMWLDRMTSMGLMRFDNWTDPVASSQLTWDDRPRETDRSWAVSGVPWTVIISLSNRLNVHPWINVPVAADDDYVRELAALFRDTLDPDLVVHVEHSNRIWDDRLPQYADALERSQAILGDSDEALMQWHSVRTGAICNIFKNDVFAGQTDRVQCILSGIENSTVPLETALNCPDWVAQEDGREPCYTHGFDILGISAGFDGCVGTEENMDEIRTWFADTDSGLTRGMEQIADGRHLPGCLRDVVSRGTTYREFSELATAYGLVLYAFEGGQHVTAVSTVNQADPEVISFHVGLNRDSRMKDRYLENFDVWREAGGRVFVHTGDMTRPGQYGSWGALESVTQETSPKWEGLMDFAGTPIWWESD